MASEKSHEKSPKRNEAETKSLDSPSLEDKSHYWNKNEKYKWTILLFFGSMIVYSVRVAMSICAAAIGKELGWNKQISGMALSAFFCGYVMTNCLGGYVSDRIGGQIVIFYTAIGWSMLTLGLPFLARTESSFISGTMAVLATRFLTGVCQGAFYPSLTAIVTKHLAVEDRGFVIAFTNSGSSIGTTLTGFFGSLIVENFNWSLVFIIVGGSALFWVAWLRFMISQGTEEKSMKVSDIKPKEAVPWLTIASRAPFWALLVGYFTASYCFYNLLSWTPIYFHEIFPESKGWLFNVVPWVVCFLCANLSGYIANRLLSEGYSVTFVRKLNGLIMFLGMAVFSLLLNYVETFKQALIVMSLNVGMNAFGNCCIAINAQDLAPKHAGALHGFANSCGAFAGVVGVYITGYILESTGKWSSVFLVTAASSTIGLFTYLIFGSGERIA